MQESKNNRLFWSAVLICIVGIVVVKFAWPGFAEAVPAGVTVMGIALLVLAVGILLLVNALMQGKTPEAGPESLWLQVQEAEQIENQEELAEAVVRIRNNPRTKYLIPYEIQLEKKIRALEAKLQKKPDCGCRLK